MVMSTMYLGFAKQGMARCARQEKGERFSMGKQVTHPTLLLFKQSVISYNGGTDLLAVFASCLCLRMKGSNRTERTIR